MFKLTYNDLNLNSMVPALTKLAQLSGLEMKTAYNIMKVFKAIKKEQEIAAERFKVEQDASKKKFDEIQAITDPAEKALKEGKFEAEVKESLKKFMEFEVTIERDQISLEVAKKAGLSAFELEALEKILVDVDGELK